ncbi:hypothetical protein ES703_123130 [subsurface metagenome]
MQVFPRSENRKTIFLFPIIIDEGCDRNPQAFVKTAQKVLNALPLVSGDHVKIIDSGFYSRSYGPLD